MADRLEALPMPTGWSERLASLRDRLLINPRFLRWAAAFPLTRLVARRRARALFDLCAGLRLFADSVRLRRAPPVRPAARTVRRIEVLATRLGLTAGGGHAPARGGSFETRRAARSRSLWPGAAWRGGRRKSRNRRDGSASRPSLCRSRRSDGAARGEMADTALGRYWPYANTDAPAALGPEQVASYSALMALSLPIVAEEVLDAYPMRPPSRLLDVGGGEGVFLVAAASRAPKPQVDAVRRSGGGGAGRERLIKAGLVARSQIFGGRFPLRFAS